MRTVLLQRLLPTPGHPLPNPRLPDPQHHHPPHHHPRCRLLLTVALTLALLVSLGLGLAPTAPALAAPAPAEAGRSATTDPETGREMLSRKHVDAGHIGWDPDAKKLVVQVIDGSTARGADEVAMRLGPDADQSGREVSRIKLPSSNKLAFLGAPGDIVWTAPSQYYPGWPPIWAGFGASATIPAEIDPDTLGLELVAVEGPGSMAVWGDGADSAHEFFSSTRPGSFQRMRPGAHGHFNWSFTEPGRYTVTWRAVGALDDGTPIASDPTDTLWLVGPDAAVGLPDGATRGAQITIPAEDFPLDPTAPTPTPTPGDGEGEPEEPAEDAEHATLPPKDRYTCLAPGHVDLAARSTSLDDIQAFVKDGTDPANPIERRSYSVVVPVPDAAATTLTPSGPFAALAPLGKDGTRIWTLPQIQDPSLVWLGFSSDQVHYGDLRRFRVYPSIAEGPGRWLLWDANLMTGSRVIMDSANPNSHLDAPEATHRHANFSFNAPGTYLANFTFMGTHASENGEDGLPRMNYGTLAVYFAVGDKAVADACGEAALPGAPVTETPDPTPTPGAPSAPGQPGAPVQPGEPGTPVQPGQGTPVNPEQPAPGTPGGEGAAPSAPGESNGRVPSASNGPVPSASAPGAQSLGEQSPGGEAPGEQAPGATTPAPDASSAPAKASPSAAAEKSAAGTLPRTGMSVWPLAALIVALVGTGSAALIIRRRLSGPAR
ncbi:MAG: choice-of-anchor M domain-containing protein [Dermabacter sp.]|nr:choice-of-anchor M domain-containing protein [Dermabacter sp.]